jgi:hypothetical protein
MGFRFRRSFGPKGLKINITKRGISSISVGGRGSTVNVPIGREGGTRYTVGIPGSGLSWSHQERENDDAHHQKLSPGKTKGAQLLAALIGLSVLATTFVLLSNGDRPGYKPATTATRTKAMPATKEAVVSDITIGPVSCTGDMTPAQCESTGAFVFYTLKNESQNPICKVTGSVGYSKDGRNYEAGGSKILFSSLFDSDDKCINPGESWRDEEGEYIANSNWASGGYANPRVVIDSVSTDSW